MKKIPWYKWPDADSEKMAKIYFEYIAEFCKTCGTKNEVRDTGTRFCKKCTAVPTVDLGFGRSED